LPLEVWSLKARRVPSGDGTGFVAPTGRVVTCHHRPSRQATTSSRPCTGIVAKTTSRSPLGACTAAVVNSPTGAHGVPSAGQRSTRRPLPRRMRTTNTSRPSRENRGETNRSGSGTGHRCTTVPSDPSSSSADVRSGPCSTTASRSPSGATATAVQRVPSRRSPLVPEPTGRVTTTLHDW